MLVMGKVRYTTAVDNRGRHCSTTVRARTREER